MKYWLCTLPEGVQLHRMVVEAMMRWRIERDYQDLGLRHCEGRGFHHHATLSIAAYGFLMNDQLSTQTAQVKKPPYARNLPYPRITDLAAVQRTQGHGPSSITTLWLRTAVALIKTRPRCPCCLRVNARQRL